MGTDLLAGVLGARTRSILPLSYPSMVLTRTIEVVSGPSAISVTSQRANGLHILVGDYSLVIYVLKTCGTALI